MAENYYDITISKLRSLLPEAGYDNMSDEFLIADINSESQMPSLHHPFRLDGFLAFFCHSGNFTIEINLKRIHVHEGVLIMYTPGNICRMVESEENSSPDFKISLVAISRHLMSNTHFDFNKLYDESLRILDNPCVELDEKEMYICHKYMDLACDIAASGISYQEHALTELFSSSFYMMGAMWSEKLSSAKEKSEYNYHNRSGRTRVTFEEFLSLVKENHKKERSLTFYADKLYLSPKYLSKLVKNVSGRSAHDWIDSFVVLEAKNLLKYSELSIKDVVYELNFTNQTTFYRFFKAKTGMTPSEFKKS